MAPALDFPASPVDGQVYSNWVYSSSKGAWQAKPLTPGQAQPSATAPTSPSNGDQWFNTVDGTLYIYYNDGDTAQWVESRAPITADGFTGPNYIINGAFDIWQRGTSSNTSGWRYVADRFGVYTATSVNVSRSTSAPSGVCTYSMSIPASSIIAVTQAIELPAAGVGGIFADSSNTFTYSFYAKTTSTNQSLTMWAVPADGVGGGNQASLLGSRSITITPTWTRYSTTLTGTAVNASNLCIRIGFDGSTTETIYVTGFQVEKSAVATPFHTSADSIQGELAACQRYYCQFDFSAYYSTGPGIVATKWSTTDAIVGHLQWPVEMRVAPAITRSSTTARFVASSGVGTVNVGIWAITSKMVTISYTNNSFAAGYGWLDSAGIFYVSAEL